jgi:hypothetical protein
VPGDSGSKTTATLPIPAFSTKAYVSTQTLWTSTTDVAFVIPKGAVSGLFVCVGRVAVAATSDQTMSTVFSDSSQQVEIFSTNGTANVNPTNVGWYFPVGM